MAYSSLSSYWLSRNRKDLAERAIVAKRDQEEQRSRQWAEISNNFRETELRTSIYSSLENTVSFVPPRVNVESLKEEEEKEAKQKELEKRRAALSKLLLEEERILQEELKSKQLAERQNDPWNIAKLKASLDELERQQQDLNAKMEEQRLRMKEERRRKGESEKTDHFANKEMSCSSTSEHHRRRLDHRLW